MYFRKLSPNDLCDLIHYWLVKELDQKNRSKVEMDLSIPPAGTTIRQDDPIWSAEAEMAAFKKAK